MAQHSLIDLYVYMNGRLVGRLGRAFSGAIDFQYDPKWLSWEHTMPISLSLPLRTAGFIGEPVLAVFENLLPDNIDIRRRLATRTHAQGADAFNLLAAMGRDCVGALQFLTEKEAHQPAEKISGRLVDEGEIAGLLRNLGRNPLGLSDDEEFRISVAGAQEKTALLRLDNQWHIPHGSTATTHILKPIIGRLPNGIDLFDSVENEHFCMVFMKEMGLKTARTEMMTVENIKVLVVERFDRRWTKDGRLLRLPQEDLCQALSIVPARKYETDGGPGISKIVKFLQASDQPQADIKSFLKAQILFWMMGATDGHAKNFSIFILPQGRFHLTPLYDVMSTQPYVDLGQLSRNKMKLAMAVGDHRHYQVETIMPRHFVQTALKAGISWEEIESVFAEISERAPLALGRTAASLPKDFPEKLVDSIVTGINRRMRELDIFS